MTTAEYEAWASSPSLDMEVPDREQFRRDCREQLARFMWQRALARRMRALWRLRATREALRTTYGPADARCQLGCGAAISRARQRARARGAGRPRCASSRSSARSGDSGEGSGPSDPSASRRCRVAPEPPPRTLAIQAGEGRIAINAAEPAPFPQVGPESGTAKRARDRAIENGQLAASGRGRYGPPDRSTVQANPIGEMDGRTVADGERGA